MAEDSMDLVELVEKHGDVNPLLIMTPSSLWRNSLI